VSNFVDFQDNGSQPAPGNASTSRLARVNGVLAVSSDGSPFEPILVGGPEAQESANAAALLGRGDLVTLWNPVNFQPQGGTFFAGTGSEVTVSGGFQLASGATANSRALRYGTLTGSVGQAFRPGVSWYFSARQAWVTTPAAGTRGGAGMFAGPDTFTITAGVDFAASGSFFCLSGAGGSTSGSPIVSTVPFDTAQHTVRAWRVGSVTSFQIDNGAIFTGNLDITVAATFAMIVGNGATAANQATTTQWYFAAVPTL